MKYLISIAILLLGQNCSMDNKKLEEREKESLTTNLDDSFETSDSVFFKQYVNDNGQYVTEQQRVTFDNGSGKTKKYMFVVAKLNSKFIGGTEQAINKLNVKAYTSNARTFDQLVWELNRDEEEPIGRWGDYYKTVIYGCCGAEDGYTIYDLETGKEFVKFSDLKYTAIPYYLNFAYLSSNTMGFQKPADKTIIGYFYHIKENLETNNDDLTSFTIHSKSENGEIAFTPEMSLEHKSELKGSGFFKTFTLFQLGDTLKMLDTADYYISLKYYGDGRRLLMPLDRNGLREQEYFSNDKELSEDWTIKRK